MRKYQNYLELPADYVRLAPLPPCVGLSCFSPTIYLVLPVGTGLFYLNEILVLEFDRIYESPDVR